MAQALEAAQCLAPAHRIATAAAASAVSLPETVSALVAAALALPSLAPAPLSQNVETLALSAEMELMFAALVILVTMENAKVTQQGSVRLN